MAEITLTNGGVALVDDEDVAKLAGHCWYLIRNRRGMYAKTRRNVAMHRLILNLNDGRRHVDHINGNGLDNRKQNLRVVSVAENLGNRQKKIAGSSKYVGVCKYKDKWHASISVDYKRINLGRFKTEEDAFAAYQAARRQYGRPEVRSE
jgi:hypothetical protein